MFDLVARKERGPADDLMSRLITNYVATDQLSRETAAMNGLILLQAGHETSASMIALGALALIEHPELAARLRHSDDPAVVADTVEELMRYLSVVHSLVERVVLEDCVIGGQEVRRGDIVLMNLPAGNWYPAFAEHPETLDPRRNARGQLGFGYGAHQCIGANLARVEMQIALVSLFRRLPGLRLAGPVAPSQFQNDQEIYGIDELLVTW
jgi:cytochrome P450